MHWTRYGNRPQEEVVDLFSDEGTQTQKFAVDSMQNRLQKVSFPEDRVHLQLAPIFQKFFSAIRNSFCPLIITWGPPSQKVPATEEQTFDRSLFSLQKDNFYKVDRSRDHIKSGPKSRQSNLLRVGSLGTRGTGGRIHRQAVEKYVSLNRIELFDAIVARIGH